MRLAAGRRKARRWVIVAASLAAALAAGCAGGKQSKRDVYYNLMTDAQREHFRQMERERKPASLKLAFVQGISVYAAWQEQPKEIQDAILRRQVRIGMTPDQVKMALGRPDRIEEVTTPADREAGRNREVWHYGERRSWLRPGGPDRRDVGFVGGRVTWLDPPPT